MASVSYVGTTGSAIEATSQHFNNRQVNNVLSTTLSKKSGSVRFVKANILISSSLNKRTDTFPHLPHLPGRR